MGVEEQEAEVFPCLECGFDVSFEAALCAVTKTYEFKCPNCGLVDHI